MHGQRGRRAAARMPGGAPPGRRGHRPDDPDAAGRGDVRRLRAARRAGHRADRGTGGGPAGERLEAERAPGEAVHEDGERAVAARVPPPGRDQCVLELPVGHEHPPADISDRRLPEADRVAPGLGDHGDACQRAGQADGQAAGPGRSRREPACRSAGGQEPDLRALGRVLPGIRVGHLQPGHLQRPGEVPGGLLVRGDVTPAGTRGPGARRGRPGPGGQVGRHGQEDRGVELVQDPVPDGPEVEHVLPVPGGPVRSGGRRVEPGDQRGVPLDRRGAADHVEIGCAEPEQIVRVELVRVVDRETARIPEGRDGTRSRRPRRRPGRPAALPRLADPVPRLADPVPLLAAAPWLATPWLATLAAPVARVVGPAGRERPRPRPAA